jgi:chromosomal replication initiation ATPase DnaA
MSILEKPVKCNCGKPDCYFCNQQKQNYWTTPGMNVDSPESVLTEVCRLTGTDPDIIKSKSRRLDVVIVRQVYCYTARELTGASMKEIGKVINRNHATVIYSCRVIADAMTISDRHVMEVLEKIKSVWK